MVPQKVTRKIRSEMVDIILAPKDGGLQSGIGVILEPLVTAMSSASKQAKSRGMEIKRVRQNVVVVYCKFLVGVFGINKFGHRPATRFCRLDLVGRVLRPTLSGEGPLVVAHELPGPLLVGGEAEGGAALAALLHPSP